MNTTHKMNKAKKFAHRQIRKIKAQFEIKVMAQQIAIHCKKPQHIVELLQDEAQQLQERARNIGRGIGI